MIEDQKQTQVGLTMTRLKDENFTKTARLSDLKARQMCLEDEKTSISNCTGHPTQIRGCVRTSNVITSPESSTWLRKELQSGRGLCMRALCSRPETQETKNTYTLFINGGRTVEPWAELTKTRLRSHRKKHGVEVKHPLLSTIVYTKRACWTKRGTNWIL